jgi:hypothetical protein
VGSTEPEPHGEEAGFAAAARRRARRMAWLYTAAAAALLPWIVYLAATLPRRQYDRHYRAAWVGFDIILVLAITRTAYLAFRLDPRVQFPATATAVLLFIDAWFDITTSSGRSQFFEALLLAVLVELPSAIFTLYLAHQVNHRILELANLDRARAPNKPRWRRPGRATVVADEIRSEPLGGEPEVSG